MKHWQIDDVAWDRFDPALVDPAIVPLVKAAAMVERNGTDYAAYLGGVFFDDPDFREAADAWAIEEVQHGDALGRWAMLADPGWDYAAAFARYRAGYKVDVAATSSIRGSRTGELIARCMVETGTSSYYTALADATAEPVLREICRQIAADEFRHFKLFYDHMRRYLTREQISLLRRLRIGFYRFRHVQRGMGMIFKAVGLPPRGRLSEICARVMWRLVQHRQRRFAARNQQVAQAG